MPVRTRPKTKWGDRQGRLRDILAAGRLLLERDGYAGLSMRAVADLAGVSPGTVYTYVSGKEELFAVLYAERLELLDRELREEAFVSARSSEDVLVAFAERYFEVYEVFGREVDVWSSPSEDGPLPEHAAQRLLAAAGAAISTVRDALERFDPGLATAPDMDIAVPFLWASLNGLAEHFSGARQALHPYSRGQLTDFAARALIAGLRAALGLQESTTTKVKD
jgi:AcrR family transcriptional regulator